MDKAKKLSNVYFDWIKKEVEFKNVDKNYVSINTPFVDNNYDNVEIYASFINDDTVEVSDFGFTLYNLEEQGMKITPRFKTGWKIFENILNDFGVTNNQGTLIIKTSLDRFPVAKTRLLQAIMRINDIYYLNKNNVTESFNEIISKFFKSRNILFTPSFEIPNFSGASSHFDFSIPNKSDKERVVKTVSRPNDVNAAKIFNFDVRATKDTRSSKFILLVNNLKEKDLNSALKATAMDTLNDETANVLGFHEVRENNTELVND